MFCKLFLEISQNSQENICSGAFLVFSQVFSCEFCEISKNTFFTEHLWMTASEGHIIISECALETPWYYAICMAYFCILAFFQSKKGEAFLSYFLCKNIPFSRSRVGAEFRQTNFQTIP